MLEKNKRQSDQVWVSHRKFIVKGTVEVIHDAVLEYLASMANSFL